MPEIAGSELRIRVKNGDITSETDGTELHGMSKQSVKEALNLQDVTAFGDTYEKSKGGLVSVELKLDGYFMPEDAGQVMLKPGTELTVAVFFEGYGKAWTNYPMVSTERERSAEVKGMQEVSVSLKGTGTPTDKTV